MPVLTYDFKDQVRQLDAGISMIIEREPTLLGLIGLNGEPLFQTKYEWMSDDLNSNIAVVQTEALADATEVTLAENEGDKIRENALLVFQDEYLRVTSIAGDVITVTRGFDNTTAMVIPAGAELRIVARPKPEGSLPGKDESKDRLVDHNFTQIYERHAAVSNTQQAVRTYNVTNELNYQVELRLKELAREFNDSLIYGRRYEGGRVVPRMTGGLLHFAELKKSAKENLAGGEVTATKLNDLIERIYQKGGQVDTFLCNTSAARQISKLAGNSIRTERTDTTTGHYIATFVSDIVGGSLATIVVDKNMPKDKVVVFDKSIITMHPLEGRSVHDVDATPNGADFVARQIWAEYGIKIKNAGEKIGILENISEVVSN